MTDPLQITTCIQTEHIKHYQNWFLRRWAARNTCCLLIQPVRSATSPPGCYLRVDSWRACVHSALFTTSALQRVTGLPQGLRLVPPGNWLHQWHLPALLCWLWPGCLRCSPWQTSAPSSFRSSLLSLTLCRVLSLWWCTVSYGER